MKLISMTDFVLEQSNSIDGFYESFTKCEKYANLLKQSNEIWMFVPCDLDGKVLEEPEIGRDKLYDSQDTSAESIIWHEDWHKRIYEYQQAKERCLFEGFEIVKDRYKSCEREFIYLPNTDTQVWRKITFHTGKIETFFFDYYEQFRIIEDLVKYNLQLTPTAIKQIGL